MLGNVLGIQSFTGKGSEFNWYVSALILLYLLTPIFKAIIDKSTKIKHHILMVGLLLVISLAYWGTEDFILIATRIPIFYLGMIYAKDCCDEKELRKKDVLGYVIALIVGVGIYFMFQFEFTDFMWTYGYDSTRRS